MRPRLVGQNESTQTMVHGGAIVDCGEASHRHTRGKQRTSFVCHDPLPLVTVLAGPRPSLCRGITGRPHCAIGVPVALLQCSPGPIAPPSSAFVGRSNRKCSCCYRSAEVAVLEFQVRARGWHVCARCHREKKNPCATLRSGSELVSLSDRILLLAACRPRVRVKRACAVGMVRRGAQIGRLGSPCKAGGHC